ncbi:hypothetical protein AGMMS49940_19850 [Spirochaetia bacterium]|nr:hypothetical protein AGMMS49940_19850 [Spirochaetia bacterium]
MPQTTGKWDVRNYLVVLFCLLGALFCIRLFWIDLNQTFNRFSRSTERTGTGALGTVVWKNGIVQRRFSDRVLWERLQEVSPVYEGDYIRTGEKSEATIQFTGGLNINLEENGLVQIFSSDTVPRIAFTQGAMSVNAVTSSGAASGEAASLILETADGGKVNITQGAVLDVRIMAEEQVDLRITEGRADFEQNGALQSLSGGDVLSMDNLGTILAEARTVMITPRPAARLLSGGGATPVDFSWKGVNYTGDDRTRLELAEDRGFTRNVRRVTGEAAGEARLNLLPGIWFWRAYPVRAGADAGTAAAIAAAAAGRLTVSVVPAPRTLTPKEGEAYHYRSSLPEVRFQWTSAPEIEYYLLEAADNPGFQNPALQTTVWGSAGETGSFTSSTLGPGRWYWRVQPILNDAYQGSIAPSNAASFTITERAAPTAPILLSPRAEALISLAENRQDIYFSWQNEPEAASYTFLVSRSPDLAAPLLTRQVTTNYYVYNPAENILEKERYYWGVYQTGTDGVLSPVSPSRPFITAAEEVHPVRLAYPPPGAEYPGLRALQKPDQVRWSSRDPAVHVRFILSRNPDPLTGEALMNLADPPSSIPLIPLSEGVYYWTIRAETRDGVNISAPVPASFRVLPILLLKAPDGRLPENGYRFGPEQLRRSSSITFRWDAVPGANAYNLALYREGNGRRQLIRRWENSGRTSQTLEVSLLGRTGSFVWQVEALSRTAGAIEQRGAVGENRFTVDLPAIPHYTASDPDIVYDL